MTRRIGDVPQRLGESDKRAMFASITADDLSGDISSQTREALANVDGQLAKIKADRSHLLVVHIWLSDMAYFQEMTSVWNTWIGSDKPPSRSCVSGKSATAGALLEIVATAAIPSVWDESRAVERFGMVKGYGRPTMCLGLACDDWFTVCLIAPDCSAGITDQIGQILTMFDGYLEAARSCRQAIQTAEIWLKDLQDVATVEEHWVEWIGSTDHAETRLLRADMARPEMLVEIRITALRTNRG